MHLEHAIVSEHKDAFMNRETLPNSESRFPHKTALVAFAAALAFWNCEQQMAGSSVGTGNPTEIEVAFTDDGGSLPLTGRMEVFASTQIPVPGFSHGPLISKSLSDQTHMNLSAADFQALQDSLWPKSSIEGESTFRFNVVVTGDSLGAVLKGLGFEKKSGTFSLRAEDSMTVRNENTAVVRGVVAPLVEIRARMDKESLHPEKNHFLFVYGTSFYALGDTGLFVFPKLPLGEYEGFMLSIGKDIVSIGDADSIFIYNTTAPIASGKEMHLDRGSIQDSIPIPDSLKVE